MSRRTAGMVEGKERERRGKGEGKQCIIMGGLVEGGES